MIYVLSDVHGNERRFNSIMKQIDLQPQDTLYILGDVVDRNPGGIRLLRRIMAMPNAKMILGNHEYMMLRALGCPYDDFLDDGNAMGHWYRNGGDLTHKSLKHFRKTTRQEIFDFLHSLPLNLDVEVNGKTYKLVHGGPVEEYDPAGLRHESLPYFAVWKRFESDYTFSGDYTLVFGHTPTEYFEKTVPMQVWYGNRMIGIDCGSGYPEEGEDSELGRLACLRLDDGKVFYSEDA